MTPESFALMTPKRSDAASLQDQLDRVIDDLLASLPNPDHLSPNERRGIIARYTAVLEGNFIYWMTSANLPVVSQQAHAVIKDHLHEESQDNHSVNLRKFPIAGPGV